MDAQTLDWMMGRVAGIGCFAALALVFLCGVAIRSGLLSDVASTRSVRAVHEGATVLWMPLGAVHVVSMVLDQTARLSPVDLIVPFRSGYAALGIGLGTVAFDLLVVAAGVAWIWARRRGPLWLWTHRLAYAAVVLAFVHAVLTGTDFSTPIISALTWSLAGVVALVMLTRVAVRRFSP
jgi:DMSO/TMAO reductase YedYZ heme-binding membrane subunit